MFRVNYLSEINLLDLVGEIAVETGIHRVGRLNHPVAEVAVLFNPTTGMAMGLTGGSEATIRGVVTVGGDATVAVEVRGANVVHSEGLVGSDLGEREASSRDGGSLSAGDDRSRSLGRSGEAVTLHVELAVRVLENILVHIFILFFHLTDALIIVSHTAGSGRFPQCKVN